MAIIPQRSLFSWTDIETASDLDRLRLVIDVMPDEGLVQALEEHRGRGRDDYPIRAVLNSIYAGIIYNHVSVESLRRELMRNAELRELCGFDPTRGMSSVPSADAYSNFMAGLIKFEQEVKSVFENLVDELRDVLSDLGTHIGYDGKAIPSWATGNGKSKVPVDRQDRRRDSDADWGKKSYQGVRKDGSSWKKVKSWFGYELHLLCDVEYELPIAYDLSKASESEHKYMLPLLEECTKEHPRVIANTRDFVADKGLDSTHHIVTLWQEKHILPIIDKRHDWKGEPNETRLLDPNVADNIVYDCKGKVSCSCWKTGKMRHMVPWGYEADRQGLKYRCPAVIKNFDCEGREQCKGAQTDYGRIVRIPCSLDPRIFTPMARDTQAWKKAYNRRSAIERVNSRIDNLLGFERHTIRGISKMKVRIGLALAVLLAMALGRIQRGQANRMRSIVTPVPPVPSRVAAGPGP